MIIRKEDIEFGSQMNQTEATRAEFVKLVGNEAPLFLKLTDDLSVRVIRNLKSERSLSLKEAEELFSAIYCYVIGAFYSACGKKIPYLTRKEWKKVIVNVMKDSLKEGFEEEIESLLIDICPSWEKKLVPLFRNYKFLEKEMCILVFVFFAADDIEKSDFVEAVEQILKDGSGS